MGKGARQPKHNHSESFCCCCQTPKIPDEISLCRVFLLSWDGKEEIDP